MATNTIKKVSEQRLYEVADLLFSAYENKIDREKLLDENHQYRNYAFGIIIHTPNNDGIELIDAFIEDDATHIANLTLRRFKDIISRQTVAF